MSEQELLKSCEDEILRSFTAIYQKNGGKISVNEAINACSYFLAVSLVISISRYKKEVGGDIQHLISESLGQFLKAIEITMDKVFETDDTDYMTLIKENYERIISNQNHISMINNYYKEIFGSQIGNVI